MGLSRFLALDLQEKIGQRIVNKSTTTFHGLHTLIDDRNDAIKCSKHKWNHEPQASGFTAKF